MNWSNLTVIQVDYTGVPHLSICTNHYSTLPCMQGSVIWSGWTESNYMVEIQYQYFSNLTSNLYSHQKKYQDPCITLLSERRGGWKLQSDLRLSRSLFFIPITPKSCLALLHLQYRKFLIFVKHIPEKFSVKIMNVKI